jgi:hypothetical protein
VTSVGRSIADGGTGGTADPVLRAKYSDFCSARVAEVLLSLSPDEMYLLAEEAARRSGGGLPERPLGYEDMVRLATEHLSSRLGLPTFEAFAAAYRENPDHFDREMLGLWQGDADPAG